jgi:hypothetical protein
VAPACERPEWTVADIFKEVDEDLRRDQAAKVWKKYGHFVIGAAVTVVLATAGYQAWTWWDLEQRTELSQGYAAAVNLFEQGKTEDAAAAFGELAETGGGYGTLAAFNRARLLADAGDTAAAIEAWDRLAASPSAGPAFRGAATVLSVMHQSDSGDPADLEARLEPLTAEDSGFRPIALELTAIMALRQGDRTRAREIYTRLADDRTAPVGLRGRASQMLAALEE